MDQHSPTLAEIVSRGGFRASRRFRQIVQYQKFIVPAGRKRPGAAVTVGELDKHGVSVEALRDRADLSGA